MKKGKTLDAERIYTIKWLSQWWSCGAVRARDGANQTVKNVRTHDIRRIVYRESPETNAKLNNRIE